MRFKTCNRRIHEVPVKSIEKLPLQLALLAAVISNTSTFVDADVFELAGGQTLQAPVLKETDEEVFLDLGFGIVGIPRKHIRSRATDEAVKATSAAVGQPGDPAATTPAAATNESIYFVRAGQKAPIQRHSDTYGEAVARITTPSGLGSGFVINAREGYVITNHHVVEKEQKITVTFFLKKGIAFEKIQKEKVRLVALNPLLDIALLKIEDMGDLTLPQVHLAPDDDGLRVGEAVFAIGNPLGLERSVSEGIASKTDREFGGLLYVQTTAAINPGNSGGPLFNERGEVVGITNMKIPIGEGLGFAIPVAALKYFLKHREAFAYDKDNPNSGFRYLPPPGKKT